jgi:hypothetical protein
MAGPGRARPSESAGECRYLPDSEAAAGPDATIMMGMGDLTSPGPARETVTSGESESIMRRPDRALASTIRVISDRDSDPDSESRRTLLVRHRARRWHSSYAGSRALGRAV